MTPSPETWLSRRLREGADTLQVPPDLNASMVAKAIPAGSRSRGVRAFVQVGLVVAVVAAVALGMTFLRSNTAEPPVANPPTGVDSRDFGTARSLLGTWEVKQMSGYIVPRQRTQGMRGGPLVTFQTDGTWTGSDGCNDNEGTYRVGQDDTFESTTESTTLMLCLGLEGLPLPASDAVEVIVNGGTAAFYNRTGEQVATFIRPYGWSGPSARLVTRSGQVFLALRTYGSGTCPTQIRSISVQPNNQLTVHLADSFDGPCTADLQQSTDVMAIPQPIDPDPVASGLSFDLPITATLFGGGVSQITLLVDTRSLVEPLLVTARDWDGATVDLARLQGVLNINDQGCVSVGTSVVVWPGTYRLSTDRGNRFAILNTDNKILGVEGHRVVLAGGWSQYGGGVGTPPDVTHSECITEDYWTGVIDRQAN